VIEATGRVVAAGEGAAVVEIPRRSSCSSCASSGGCGVSTLAKLFGAGMTQVEVIDSLGLRAGDKVVVAIGDGALVQASMLAYLLPILAMAAAAALAARAGIGDMGSALAAAVGLTIGLLLAARITRASRLRAAFQPTLIRRIATEPLQVAIPSWPSPR
jgi:sigma-E factor negative regulatory protein RseC